MRSYNLIARILPLKALLLDADGVMTPGGIWYSDTGDQFKRFDVTDGLGLFALNRLDLILGIITGKNSRLLEKRANELGVADLYQDYPYKIPAYEDFIEKHKLSTSEVGFVGDDIIDIPVMEACGFSACPSDAAFAVKRRADWVTRSPGGAGSLREIAEIIIAAKTGKFPPDEFFIEFASGLPAKT